MDNKNNKLTTSYLRKELDDIDSSTPIYYGTVHESDIEKSLDQKNRNDEFYSNRIKQYEKEIDAYKSFLPIQFKVKFQKQPFRTQVFIFLVAYKSYEKLQAVKEMGFFYDEKDQEKKTNNQSFMVANLLKPVGSKILLDDLVEFEISKPTEIKQLQELYVASFAKGNFSTALGCMKELLKFNQINKGGYYSQDTELNFSLMPPIDKIDYIEEDDNEEDEE